MARRQATTASQITCTRTSKRNVTPRPQDELQRQQLQTDRRRLAEEDAGRVDAREPQAVARALARLDGDAALNGQHGREEQRHPEDPRCGVTQRRLVRADGEREQHQHEDGERHHLPQADTRARLDAQVLARDEHGVMPHEMPPRPRLPLPARDAGTAVRVTRRPPGSSPVTRPPTIDTTRSANGTERCGSCEESSTRRAGGDGFADQLTEQGAGAGIEPGVRLVEQPEGGIASNAAQRGRPGGAGRPRGARPAWSAGGRSGRDARGPGRRS